MKSFPVIVRKPSRIVYYSYGKRPSVLLLILLKVAKLQAFWIWGDAVALWIDRRTSGQEVTGSIPAWSLLRNNLRQVVHTLVPLSPSSINLYRCKNWK